MSEVLERRFRAIGARLRVVERPGHEAPKLDIRVDGHGELFELEYGRGVEAEAIDVRPRDRHLLLLVREESKKSKFLCGHDERHWFVAAVPERARGVTGVQTAKAALQPAAVQAVVEQTRPKDRFRRRNDAYVRQGEWFFVPAPGLRVDDTLVLRDEPLTRGRGKAHVMQFVYRTGGQVVWVSNNHPTGIGDARYRRLTENQRRGGGWMRLVRDPQVYAKGAVRHPDHATVHLRDWHRVLMNTEHEATAMKHVVFID